MKTWRDGDIYNFNIEFNRIEEYNKYCNKWLVYYQLQPSINTTIKTNWSINDIPDIKDLNRIKQTINSFLSIFGNRQIAISTQVNQKWTKEKANELEQATNTNLQSIGNMQFRQDICGLAICGNNSRLGGVL